MTVRYKLGCELSYQVMAPTVFIFNIEVARLQRHQDLVETPVLQPGSGAAVLHGARRPATAMSASPPDAGPLTVSYQADVTLDVFRADPATIHEMPLTELPLDIMPFLLPSRFVSSDRLAAFA